MPRLVVLSVPSGQTATVRGVLEEVGADYTLTDATEGGRYEAMALFTLPTAGVEPVLADLREAGIPEGASTVVLDTATVLSDDLEALEERYTEEEDTAEERIAAQELKSSVRELLPTFQIYVVMMLVSAFIAAAGLLLDSAAIVVGSMVIAPFIGPAMASNVGTVLDDSELFVRGVKLQFAGIGLAIAGATAFALAVRGLNLVPPGMDITAIPQIDERTSPDFLSLAVALGAGVAGVTSLTTGMSSAIVGVMIAVALIPPAATVGIGLAWGTTTVAVGAGVLMLVNVLSINLAALGVLWYMGYRPQRWYWVDRSREDLLKQVAVLVVSLAVLSAFLGSVTYSSFRTATTEEAIEEDVLSALDRPAYAEYSLLELDVQYSQGFVSKEPQSVTVRVGVPPDAGTGSFADSVRTAIGDHLDRGVPVEIRYVTIERA